MDKKLIQFYVFFIIMLFLFIMIFPNLFSNLHNHINYLQHKIIIAFKLNEDTEININRDLGNVIIMFDDGWKTQYTVGYRYMEKKNMRGSIAIIPSLVGEKDYMDIGHLYQLDSDNWDLLSHTYSHYILSEITADEQLKEINKVDQWFNQKGFNKPHKILIYPEGKYNDDTIEVLKKLNYVSGRGVNDGFNPPIPRDLYNIKVKNVLTYVPVNEVEKWIDYAVNNKQTLILLFHKLEGEVDKYNMKYNEKNFYEIIDYLDKKREFLNIITYLEWMEINIDKIQISQ
ncbi:MAG: polysaccharide deacetylase family protein [Bacilli bacterium]|nr:polysaccharide deacetylase family protein [Bacilli bacterium]MDD4808543.1 polysaccharide deacetylase family protein [Bacilli bacterium]